MSGEGQGKLTKSQAILPSLARCVAAGGCANQGDCPASSPTRVLAHAHGSTLHAEITHPDAHDCMT